MEEVICIGLMSGTSLDGVDGCIVGFKEGDLPLSEKMSIYYYDTIPMPKSLRTELLNVSQAENDSVDSIQVLEAKLTRQYSKVTERMLIKSRIPREKIQVLGTFGQTIRHRPLADTFPFTVQIVNGAQLAEETHMTVVTDVRRSDIARGGEGAPLAPAFHKWCLMPELNKSDECIAIVNIGGIANITLLSPDKQIIAFDTGPGNILLDGWINHNLGKNYDKNGKWADKGKVNTKLLKKMLSEPYFALNHPKTTGRELFNVDWLKKHLKGFANVPPTDVQATLQELTAVTISDSIRKFNSMGSSLFTPLGKKQTLGVTKVYVCGGGAKNVSLMNTLESINPDIETHTTSELGLDPTLVECSCAAWYAYNRWILEPIDLHSITGAKKGGIMGAMYVPADF